MPFADRCMARQSLFTEDVSTDHAMGDIRPVTVAVQLRGVGKEHGDVMQKRCLLDETLVNRFTLSNPFSDPEGKPCNQMAVSKQEVPCLVMSCVILIN